MRVGTPPCLERKTSTRHSPTHPKTYPGETGQEEKKAHPHPQDPQLRHDDISALAQEAVERKSEIVEEDE